MTNDPVSADRFRVDAVLGEGGMGSVFAAHDLNLDRPVAIKRLHGHLLRDEAIARFFREARVMARLSSEHTVRVYELGEDAEGAPYIVMERVWGRGLSELVAARGPLPLDEAIDYLRQACLALEEAHAYGIVHRDVKPSNILVQEDAERGPRVKVVDFGVAKACPRSDEDRSGLTSITALLGTPEYMAPEQLYAARDVDARADIWGLGATLYFMLVGEPPFTAPDLAQLLHRIQYAPAPLLRARRPEVPAYVEAVIQRCLHRDPAGRYRSASDVARALTPLHAGGLPSLVAEESGPLYEPTLITDGSAVSSPEVTQRMPSANVPPETKPTAAPRGWKLPAALAVGAVFGAVASQLLARL
jgi:eukaryotic-like serine/threonine-protein kinase